MKKFSSFISEMAQNMGRGYNPLGDEHRNSNWYKTYSHPETSPEYKTYNSGIKNPDIKVHKNVVPGKNIRISTLDHKNKSTLHYSIFSQKSENDWLHEPHMVQMDVHKTEHKDLPKGHASKIFFHQVDATEMPHVSSDTQYEAGHKMWRGLAHHALKNGLNVYHHDGKKIVKTTHENVESHLDNSFGDSEKHQNTHMIISKYPLQQVK